MWEKKAQKRFTAQEFWQNCYWLDLLDVCEIFLIIDLIMCNIITQKNITSQKQTKDKVILLNDMLWLTCIQMNHKFILFT